MTRADVCALACAEAWRGDGEVVASAMGTIPMLGARLAKATFSPDLVVTDGQAMALDVDGRVEAWLPFRHFFDVVWGGRRHVMMGASQVDRFGNQNIACIGPWSRPKAQLLGVRGAPGNTVNHTTSYWVPNHSVRVFVPAVDFVSGVGYDRAAGLGGFVAEHHSLRRVVTNLAVLDFSTADGSMRLRSVHPGVSVADVVAATGFPIVIEGDDVEVEETPTPTAAEVALLDRLDPDGLRHAEVRSP